MPFFFVWLFVPIICHCKVYHHTVAACALRFTLNLQICVVGRLTYVSGNVLAVFVKKFAISDALVDNCFWLVVVILLVKLVICRIEGGNHVLVNVQNAAITNVSVVRLKADQKGNKICLVLARDAALMCQLVSGGVGNGIIGEVDVDIRLTRKEGVNARDVRVGHRLAQHNGLDAAVKLIGIAVLLGKAQAECRSRHRRSGNQSAVAIWYRKGGIWIGSSSSFYNCKAKEKRQRC